jgi:hypothetical protein
MGSKNLEVVSEKEKKFCKDTGVNEVIGNATG